MERALSFGSVASAYDATDSATQPELVDEVLAYAGRPVRSALEIGAGTGKATRAFAARGVAVTATEPDAAMLAELRKHVPSTVSACRPVPRGGPGHLDVRPGVRRRLAALDRPGRPWPRIAALLIPGGVFASFGGPARLADPAVEDAVRMARLPFLADDEIPSPDGTPPDSPMQWPGTELTRSDEFTDVRQLIIERRATVSAADYLGHLSTISAYNELSAPVREQAFRAIGEVLPAQVTLVADLTVHLARRR